MSLLDRPTAMTSWDDDSVQDLDCVYQSKATPDRGDIDTVWQSMYEKSLGRKVSQYSLPPQAANEFKAPEDSGNLEPEGSVSPESSVEQETSQTIHEKQNDFARVHLERALNLGKLGRDDIHGRRWRKRTYSNSSTGSVGEQSHVELQHEKHK